MNTIGFVFCILIILSFGAIVSLEKQVGAHRLRSTYLGHITANRQILNQTTSAFYASLKEAPKAEEKEKEEKKKEEIHEPHPLPLINPECARLNLLPLIEHELEQERYLYETAAKLFRTFYAEALLGKEKRAEYIFLDAFLKAVRQQIRDGEFTLLEKVSFKEPRFQKIYYQMLKGTKRDRSYPSLLDYIKIETTASKVCLFHAHPRLLSVFFTSKGANKLYASIHTPKAPPLTQELIERVCKEMHAPLLDPQLFDLLELSQSNHPKSAKATLIGEDPDTQISLRKVVTLHKSE